MRPRPVAESEPVPVQPVILLLSALLVLILVTAFIILYVLPHDVGGSIFAWPINPRMSSMMLGATYLGGAYFFLVTILSRKWRHVRLGLIPVTTFAATMGLNTLLHWPNFSHERIAFVIWAILYFTVPFFLPILWYRNEKLASGEDIAREGAFPLSSRWAFGALGVILTIASLLLFFTPQLMLAAWPWTLSPLTARIMAAIFILTALTGLSLAYDGSWSGARYILQAQALPVILMIIAAYVARDDFDWANPASWFFVGGLIFMVLLVVYTYTVKRNAGQ